MTPQKITVKIPRKESEMIPFDVDKWNTGEYEAYNSVKKKIGRVLCTDNGGHYPVIVAYGNSAVSIYTFDGRITLESEEAVLFLRKKSEGELPNDLFINLYPSQAIYKHRSLEVAQSNAKNAGKENVAIVHITYTWED